MSEPTGDALGAFAVGKAMQKPYFVVIEPDYSADWFAALSAKAEPVEGPHRPLFRGDVVKLDCEIRIIIESPCSPKP